MLQAADLSALNHIKYAAGAGYNHRDRCGCLEGTRVALLDDVEQWTKDQSRSSIFWLNGLAGTGKSRITQTVAEQCDANGTLGASFFFPGAPNEPSGLIFPTLAFQLAHKYPNFRSTLIPYLQSNPDITHESLKIQAEKLIMKPLQFANVTTVIIVDALDECKEKKSSSAIVTVLGNIVAQMPKVKLFITSKPDPQIRSLFYGLRHITEVCVLHGIASDIINSDIQVFLEHELSRLAKERGLDNWPTAEQLDLLCNRAACLFTYAFATVKFLGIRPKMPNKRYTIIERSKEETIHEGRVEGVHRGMSLDSLCTSVLQSSFGDYDAEGDKFARLVLAAALLTDNPLPSSAILEAVCAQTEEPVDINEVMQVLESAHSLLDLPEDQNQPVRPIHKLLSDCLKHPGRCSDSRFLIRNHVNTS